jgi:hypothetical protein
MLLVKPMTQVIKAKNFNATEDKNGKENEGLADKGLRIVCGDNGVAAGHRF